MQVHMQIITLMTKRRQIADVISRVYKAQRYQTMHPNKTLNWSVEINVGLL